MSGSEGTGIVLGTLSDDSLTELASWLGDPGVRERWANRGRKLSCAETISARAGEARACAALVSTRPHTSYLKIVDTVGDPAAAVAAVVAVARQRRLAKVAWEGEAGTAPPGFTPHSAARWTFDPHPPDGAALWLSGPKPREIAYSQQRTAVSCGAVAALLGEHALRLSSDQIEPAHHAVSAGSETALWARATNFPACDPVGLAVALHSMSAYATITVMLDAVGPVMLESFDAEGAAWRGARQLRHRQRACELGIAIEDEPWGVLELRRRLDQGEKVLTVLWLERMMGIAAPHWVLCHAAVDGAIVVQDPWISDALGESWVDAHLLPIGDADFDAMWRLHDGRSRAAIRLRQPIPG